MSLVVICSLVRDGMSYLPSYRRQLESLTLEEGSEWRLCILEGDSCDGSWEFLQRWAEEDSRIVIGKEEAGDAAEIEDRAARWARVGNSCLALVPEDLDYSHLLWIESDLCFPPELLRRLLAHDVDVVAPMIWLGGLFYDTWGYRDIDGNPWTNHAPYHPDYVPMSLMEMGSVGSCVLFRRAILDAGVRYQGTYQNGLLVGMCHDARALGYRVFVDTSTAILHPVDNWEAQMWRPSQLVIIDSSGNAADMPLAEARGLGLEMHIAALDPNMMLQANGAFLRNLCWRYRSNRISVEVQARPYPRKLYRMQVHIGDPEPVFFKNPVTRLIPRGILRKKLQKELRTSLTIEIEESAEVG